MFSLKITNAVNGYILEWKSENQLSKEETPRHEVFNKPEELRERLVKVILAEFGEI